jgi:hypothetical protein
MAVVKLHPDEAASYLEWDPDFSHTAPLPPDRPDMPAAITGLTVDDMQKGLASAKFRARAVWLRDNWCGLLQEAFAPATVNIQATEEHRWTIHPDVDGCEPAGVEPPK